jgi:hypothetical protein
VNATISERIAEKQALEAMLGIGPPVLLDIRPVDLLTAGERRRFAKRQAVLARELKSPFDRKMLKWELKS